MFTKDALAIDADAEIARIVEALTRQVRGTLRRRGVVLGLSGGVDSSLCAALAASAFGSEGVTPLLMPERDSSPESIGLGRLVAETFGLEPIVEDIQPILEAFGCYERQDEAIRMVFPEFEAGWRFKLVLPPLLESERLNVTRLVVKPPEGDERDARMSPAAYRQIVAATNFKQRTRKMLEYYHADRLGAAVIGTPNRLEYDQGFFVKQGDGAADVKPIAHLYKTQVYALAAHLGVPEAVRSQPPTTDTFSLPQTQEEFYFALPYDRMDLCLRARDLDVSPEEAAPACGLTPDQVERVYRDIEAKRRAASYLHATPLRIEDAP